MTAAMALRPGITLLTAETVESGLALIRSNNVDAILLDIGLPDGSGWDLLRTIREDAATASIPAVVVTAGHGRVPNGTKGLEQVMTKPLDIGVCIETLDGLLTPSR
jgi:DNA-binding response OmpR family regulator